MPGKFITLEGCEGCGKTTQVIMLGKHLVKKGRKVLVTLEPGGTRIGAHIRDILLDPENKNMNPFTESLLYAAGCHQATHIC